MKRSGVGWNARLRAASFRMFVAERDSLLCLGNCQDRSVEAFPSPVRTGRLRKQLIVSSQMLGLMRRRSWPGIFSARGIASPPGKTLRCWCFTTRQSSLTETTEAFLEGHVRAFAYFGGVPTRILYDNT